LINHRDISQFRKTFTEIEEYRQRSGCHWDNDLGAGIEGEDASSVFKDYVKVCSLYSSPLFMTNLALQTHPHMRHFNNKGWEYYHLVQAYQTWMISFSRYSGIDMITHLLVTLGKTGL